MLLENGAMIKADVIKSFNRAVEAKDNIAQGLNTTNFWNFVESDMYMELSIFYSSDYIMECFDRLADEWESKELEQALPRLEILKKDYLGINNVAS